MLRYILTTSSPNLLLMCRHCCYISAAGYCRALNSGTGVACCLWPLSLTEAAQWGRNTNKKHKRQAQEYMLNCVQIDTHRHTLNLNLCNAELSTDPQGSKESRGNNTGCWIYVFTYTREIPLSAAWSCDSLPIWTISLSVSTHTHFRNVSKIAEALASSIYMWKNWIQTDK